MRPKKATLMDIAWPEIGEVAPPPRASLAEFQARLASARREMAARHLTHLVVYGDREHFANLVYLTGFDPRFEEALLVLRPEGTPLLIVGNECAGYLNVSPLYVAGQMRYERFPTFSLLNQPRAGSRLLQEILADEGICQGSAVGAVGWKYFGEGEQPDATHAVDLPGYITDTLRELAGRQQVVNATDILMHPDYGLRTFCSAAEIAFLEYSSALASEGVKRMIFGLRPGMSDFELVKLAQYNGLPLGCHITMVSGDNRDQGLSSPIGASLRRGDPFASNLSYWGSNVCRAGWIAESAKDLPANAQDYVEQFAAPYFEAMAEWFGLLRIGAPGGALSALIAERLPFERFGIFLNAGHLIHWDEWLSSPIFPGSPILLHSGMAMQVDVIPDSPVYFSTRMEDGVALADAALHREIAERFSGCFARCMQRRAFMTKVLGIALPEEILPLSNMPAIIPPFLLAPNKVLALR